MEHIVHIWQLWRQLQLVSYLTSLFQNNKWSNEPRCELASNLEMVQTSHRWHLEVHKISNFKAQLSSPMITTALLPRLRNSQVLPNHTNLLPGFLQNVGSKKPSVLQPHSKTTEFDTYDHTTSQTAPSSSSLDSYCYRRSQHTGDSYPNFFHIAGHKLLPYLLESD
jgi:hypothetical protein